MKTIEYRLWPGRQDSRVCFVFGRFIFILSDIVNLFSVTYPCDRIYHNAAPDNSKHFSLIMFFISFAECQLFTAQICENSLFQPLKNITETLSDLSLKLPLCTTLVTSFLLKSKISTST